MKTTIKNKKGLFDEAYKRAAKFIASNIDSKHKSKNIFIMAFISILIIGVLVIAVGSLIIDTDRSPLVKVLVLSIVAIIASVVYSVRVQYETMI